MICGSVSHATCGAGSCGARRCGRTVSARSSSRRRPRVDGSAQFTRRRPRDPCVDRASRISRTGASVGPRPGSSAVGTEPETHALRASRRYRGHRGLLHVPSVVAFVEAHVARTREDRARYKRGSTTGPSSSTHPVSFRRRSPTRQHPARVHPRQCTSSNRRAVDDLNEATPATSSSSASNPERLYGCVDVRHVGIITAADVFRDHRDHASSSPSRRHRPDRRSRDRRPRQRHRALSVIHAGCPRWEPVNHGSLDARGPAGTRGRRGVGRLAQTVLSVGRCRRASRARMTSLAVARRPRQMRGVEQVRCRYPRGSTRTTGFRA